MLQSRLYFDTVVTRCHTWWVTQWYPSPLLSAYINYSSRTGYCYQFHLQCFLLELLYISQCVLILKAESEITALIKHTACSYRVMHCVHCGFYSCFCGCAPDDETVSSSHVGVSSPLLRFFSFFLHKYALRCLSSDAHYTLRSRCGQGPFPDSATPIRFTIAPTWFWTFLFFFSKKNGSSVYVCVCEAVSSCRRAAPLLSESESRSCHAKAQPVSVNINVTGWVTSSSSDCSTLTSETPCGSAVYV